MWQLARLISSSTILIVLSVLVPVAAFGVSYEIVDLGVLGTKTYAESYATAINNLGQVVGYSYFPNDSPFTYRHAFLYENGQMSDLTPNTIASSDAQDINDSGQIVGHVDGRAVIYQDGIIKDIGTLRPYGKTQATGINNYGQVTGWTSGDAINNYHAFLYENGTMTDLDTLRPDQNSYESYGQAINDQGHIVGDSSATWGNGFIYEDGNMEALLLPYSWARDINNSGEIVGFARDTYNSLNQAFIFSDETFSTLTGLNAKTSYANALNEHGAAVGHYYLEGISHSLAFLYDGNNMLDLNDLIANDDWLLLSAADINENGQIVGNGLINGQTHAFLMTPVPEPSTLLLAGVGIFVLIFFRWRKPLLNTTS